MKKVLALVLSTEKVWYSRLAETSLETWDSQDVDGVETVFYFGHNPNRQSTDKLLFTEVLDDFHNMGRKTLTAFEYALTHRTFDYVFRANASLYIHKPGLLRYVQNWPSENLALGVVANCGEFEDERFPFLWGPGYMLSHDVVQKVVDNQAYWDHRLMDDNAISRLLTSLEVPLDNRGSLASIATKTGGYDFVYYENGAGGGTTLQSLSELPRALPNQFAFRVKDDANRDNDVRLMKELYSAFQ